MVEKIALVGSPNCGKTTLFNLITGSRYETANYPGATVEYAKARIQWPQGGNCEIIDTPGIPSLSALSADESVTIRALWDAHTRPQLLLAVADVTQLSRHLYLVRQLIELGRPVVLILTMLDRLEQQGYRVDVSQLERYLGIPILVIDPRRTKELPKFMADLHSRLSIAESMAEAPKNLDLDDQKLQALWDEDDDAVQMRYFEVDEICAKVLHSFRHNGDQSRAWDRFFLHSWWGLIFFLLMMTFLYTSIFWLAAPLMDGVDAGFSALMDWMMHILPEHWLSSLWVEGVVGGIAAMAVFLPQIMILFLLLGALEDSGYLARGAALIDKPLSKIGLNGRSFVPLLSGYACAIPAMMAARTIPGSFERLLTMAIVPLMTCSARLPVFVLLVAFLTPKDQPWLGGIAMTGIYVAGALLGIVISWWISRWAPKNLDRSFVMELPAIRRPVLKIVAVSALQRSKSYVQKAGFPIVLISVILWSLVNFNSQSFATEHYERPEIHETFAAQVGHWIEPITEPMGLDWRGGVALLSGFAAREVFVSSLALVYRADDEDEERRNLKLMEVMRTATFEDGRLIFSLSTCLGIILFYMIAMQCFPTVVTAKTESGRWSFALGLLVAYSGGAWVLTVLLVQGLRFMGIP
jgi:ferrous iron transport protein B